MATNGDITSEDVDMAESDGDKVVTMMDVLQEQQEFEDNTNAVLGGSDDKNCTYSKGYVKRQAVYACLTCCPEATTDPSKRAGVCLACSLACHETHELVELYTKRNFRCDCGNPKFTQPCQFTPNKSDLNYDNKYNHNFSGTYCICKRPYPDPEVNEEQEMLQCIICEDWLHSNHLEATVPDNDQYEEMICKACMDDYGFLHDYSDLVVNTIDKEVIVMDPDLDFDVSPKKSSPTKTAKKEIVTNGSAGEKPDMDAEGILDSIDKIVGETKKDDESSNAEKQKEQTKEEEVHENQINEISNNKNSEENEIDMDSSESKAEQKDAINDASNQNGDAGTKENIEDNIENKETTEPETNIKESTTEEGTTEPEASKTESETTTTESEASKTESETGTTEPEASKTDSEAGTTEPETSTTELETGTTEPETSTTEPITGTTEPETSTTEPITGTTEPEAGTTEPEAATTEPEVGTIETEAGTTESESGTTEPKSQDTTPFLEDNSNLEREDTNEKEETEIKDVKEDESDVKEKQCDSADDISSKNETENKRKRSTEDEENSSSKKAKMDKPCIRPKGVKRVYKGATFWPANLRQKLCSCGECVAMYKDLAVLYLIDPDDTVNAYEALGKDNCEGPASQYEKGLQALQSLDRVQQINALTEYNKMRDKLLDFLKSFKDRKEIVKEEDIRSFFAGMKPKREPDGVYFCR